MGGWLDRLLGRDGGEKSGEGKLGVATTGTGDGGRPTPEEAAAQRDELRRRQDAARLQLIRLEAEVRRRVPGGD